MENIENFKTYSELKGLSDVGSNNTNFLYVINQKMKEVPYLSSLVNLFSLADNDAERMQIVEKILFCLAESDLLKSTSYRKIIDLRKLSVLETLDNLSLISFSRKCNGQIYSEIELADVVECEFENLKIETYAKLMQQLYSKKYFSFSDVGHNFDFAEIYVANNKI